MKTDTPNTLTSGTQAARAAGKDFWTSIGREVVCTFWPDLLQAPAGVDPATVATLLSLVDQIKQTLEGVQLVPLATTDPSPTSPAQAGTPPAGAHP